VLTSPRRTSLSLRTENLYQALLPVELRKEIIMGISGKISDHGENALSMFMSGCAAREEEHDQASLDFIEEMLADAKRIDGNAGQYGQTQAVQSRAILMWWGKYNPTDIQLRSIRTGKAAEQLRKEDEEAERKRQQSKAWRAQGLCGHCGGQLGMFKKCKSCGAKN
jgi:hypothetical protein